MNVSLRQLRVFLAIARAGNFSRAGDAIGLTQPAISRSIGELEAQMGLKLLDRTTREVVLTEAGQTLMARLGRVVEELDQALADVAGLVQSRAGKVRVASSPTLSANLMPECIASCAQKAPGIQLILLDRIQQDVLTSVRNGEVDFGVVIEPTSAQDLHGETIMRDPFVLVAPFGHALLRTKRVRWSALHGEPLVLLDHASGSRRLIDEALARHQATCPVTQELGHPTTVFRMVEAGLGISVMPALSVPATGLPGLQTRPLTPIFERRIMLVRRHNRALAPLSRYVWDLIQARFSP